MKFLLRSHWGNTIVFLVSLAAFVISDSAIHPIGVADGRLAGTVGQESGLGGKLPPTVGTPRLEGGKWHLNFKFNDTRGGKHDVSCAVSDADHQELVAKQGFYEARKPGEINKRIVDIVTKVSNSLGVGENGCAVPAHWVGPDWAWNPQLPATHDFEERREKLEKWIEGDFAKKRKAARELWIHQRDCSLPLLLKDGARLRSINTDLASSMTAKAAELGLTAYGAPSPSSQIGADWTWRIGMPKTDEFRQHEKNFLEWFQGEYAEMRTAQENQYMKERGFRWDRFEGWVLDYSSLVQQAAPVLDDCIQRLDAETRGDAQIDPETLMAFFVAMPREDILRVNPDGKFTQGFRVPTSVLIENSGDCDSKSAAFCVIRGRRPEHLVIFRTYPLPKGEENGIGHALVGIEAYASGDAWKDPTAFNVPTLIGESYQRPVEVDNRYYWPCEVGGPGWNDFKSVAQGRGGDYEAIPIRPLEAASPSTAPQRGSTEEKWPPISSPHPRG
jgi:hypothetical protein